MTDEKLLNIIRHFLAAENKPQNCTPTDMLQVVRLLVQHGAEQEVGISRGTLSVQLCCGESTIYESQQRLKEFGWVNMTKGKRHGKPNRFTVAIDALPIAEPLKRTVITPVARELAKAYAGALKSRNPKRRFMKGWEQQYAFRLQDLLNKCNGDPQRLVDLTNFAFSRPEFAAKARRGPHELRKSWKSLKAAYEDAQRATQAEQQQAVA